MLFLKFLVFEESALYNAYDLFVPEEGDPPIYTVLKYKELLFPADPVSNIPKRVDGVFPPRLIILLE